MSNLSDWIGVMSLVVSVVAVWYTIHESRRNNSVIIAVRTCRAFTNYTGVGSAYRACHIFEIALQNRGLSLHQIEVKLLYRNIREGGIYQISLRPSHDYKGEFAKGMIAHFEMSSDNLKDVGKILVSGLKNPVEQKAELRVLSQGYLVYTIPVGNYYQRLVSLWNKKAMWLKYKLSRTIKRENQVPQIRDTITLPEFVSVLSSVSYFARSISQELEKKSIQRPTPDTQPVPQEALSTNDGAFAPPSSTNLPVSPPSEPQ